MNYIFRESPPSLCQLIESPFLRKWIVSKDLYASYQLYRNDYRYNILSLQEYNESEEMNLQLGNIGMINSEIIINETWKDLTVEHCEMIIKEFTHTLKFPQFSHSILRNRKMIPLSFCTAGKNSCVIC